MGPYLMKNHSKMTRPKSPRLAAKWTELQYGYRDLHVTVSAQNGCFVIACYLNRHSADYP